MEPAYMEMMTFSIRRTFLLPLGLTVLLSIILLGSALFLKLATAKIIILSALLLPAGIFFAESIRRQVLIDSSGVQVRKLLGRKKINFSDLTAVDTIQVRKRAFLSLSSENDFIIISNSYEDFGTILKQLVDNVPASIVSDNTLEMVKNPPQKGSDIFSAWLAVAVLALIIYVQLRGLF